VPRTGQGCHGKGFHPRLQARRNTGGTHSVPLSYNSTWIHATSSPATPGSRGDHPPAPRLCCCAWSATGSTSPRPWGRGGSLAGDCDPAGTHRFLERLEEVIVPRPHGSRKKRRPGRFPPRLAPELFSSLGVVPRDALTIPP